VRHVDDRLARLKLRVGQHLGRTVDAPGRDPVPFERGEQVGRRQGGGPRRDVCVELRLVFAARGVVHVARILRQRLLAHRRAQAGEHRVLVRADQDHLAVARRVDV